MAGFLNGKLRVKTVLNRSVRGREEGREAEKGVNHLEFWEVV